jgi:hypothetical protein
METEKIITTIVCSIIGFIVRAIEKKRLKKKGLLFDTPPNMNGKGSQ